MEIPQSIAIIGEGETEWFYFDSLRVTCRYPFKIAPTMPQHSDISHMAKLAEQLVTREYDIVVCLVDMDRIYANTAEMASYKRIKAKSSDNILWIETNPCTEFWFLLHFIPSLSVRQYNTSDEVLMELQKYIPDYKKTARYFRRVNLYKYLQQNGNQDRARQLSRQLSKLNMESPEDKIAYSQIGTVMDLLDNLISPKRRDENSKTTNSDRIGEIEDKILDFLTTSSDSDSKSIANAIGLKSSRTADYIKRLLASGKIECSEGWKKTYRIKKQ